MNYLGIIVSIKVEGDWVKVFKVGYENGKPESKELLNINKIAKSEG